MKTWAGLVMFLAAAFLVSTSVPSVQAAPAYVAVADREALDEAPDVPDDEDIAMNRDKRYATGGSGGSGAYSSDDEDYPDVKPTNLRKPEIRHFYVEASITARFANTLISSLLINPAEYSQEATFSVVIPDEAFISKFLMVIEGVTYEAQVKEKEVAQREYNAAKERGETAGQVKQHATKPNTFTVSVNVASYSNVHFNLTYQELLHRRHGVIEYRLNINPRQVVAKLKVDVRITEPQGLQEMDAMWMPAAVPGSVNSVSNDVIPPLKDVIYLERLSQNRAHIRFQATKDQQKMEREDGIIGDLVVQYDVLHDLSAGNLQVMNGYFVHYFSPEGLVPARKNVVFVIDVSGSMYGLKISQTQEAMRTILRDIREGDKLNIVTFESYVDVWLSGNLADRTDESIEDAIGFVDELYAGGGTNLHGGIMAGVELLKAEALVDIQSERDALSMIIMLTDGLPSSGVTSLNQIRDNVMEAIDGQFSLFCLGFGQNLDYNFLDNLATENQGVARKIYEDSSASVQLKGFYDEVATPLLFNVNIEYNNINALSTTQTNFLSYFEGTEIVVAGQLPENSLIGSDVTELVATVFANSMDQTIELETATNIQTPTSAVLSRHAVDDFCQRLWAYLTIKSLLKSAKISRNRQEKDELKARALQLSMTYHFVTPLTSLLVVRPDEGENSVSEPVEQTDNDVPEAEDPDSDQQAPNGRHPAMHSGTATGGSGGRFLSTGRGGGGGGAGGGGGFADSDPHFVVHVPSSNVSVCFDILGEAGQLFNLLTDAKLGIQVLGFIVAAPKPVQETGRVRTYFGRIVVRLPGGHTVRLGTGDVVVNDRMTLSWKNTVTIHRGNWSIAIRNKEALITTNEGAVGLAFMMHRMNPANTFKVDHLGFYIVSHDGLSDGVHGLIGQFQRREVQVSPAESKEPVDGDRAVLKVGDRRVDVTRKSRLNSLLGHKQPCWFATDNANGLIDGKYTDYLLPMKMMQ